MKLLQPEPFIAPAGISRPDVESAIQQIASFPEHLRETLQTLKPEQLETKTLPGVWNVAQVVHHVADSHMNAFVRCKLALTEDAPAIKPYEEGDWAKLADSGAGADVQLSAQLLQALHVRWSLLWRSLRDADWKRVYFHPGQNRKVPLDEMVLHYAWHGRNHLAHIHQLMQAKSWIQ